MINQQERLFGQYSFTKQPDLAAVCQLCHEPVDVEKLQEILSGLGFDVGVSCLCGAERATRPKMVHDSRLSDCHSDS